jgi:hypothetical protein
MHGTNPLHDEEDRELSGRPACRLLDQVPTMPII